jgi:peptidoglycan/xylan/chitin deacetylase (PgdA/CDA1 family)
MKIRSLTKHILYAIRALLPRKRGALILAYHSIGEFNDPYTVSAANFEWQLGEIKRQGLQIISLEELENMMDRGNVHDKTVVLTFDDGRDDNYTHLFPILKKYGMRATIFSITGFIGKTWKSSVRPNPMLTDSQMHEMQQSGLVDFQVHTVTHPKLTQVSLEQVKTEVNDSKNALEGMLSKECAYFCYPHGRTSEEIRGVLLASGIRLACSGVCGFVTAKTERLLLPRAEVKRKTSKTEFKSILKRGSLR